MTGRLVELRSLHLRWTLESLDQRVAGGAKAEENGRFENPVMAGRNSVERWMDHELD